MPRKEEHIYKGMLLAVAVGGASAHDQPPTKAALEIAGSIAGGYVGARFPDVVEPANRPNHWGFAHSIAAGVGLSVVAIRNGPQLRDGFRAAGDEFFAMQSECRERFLPWFLCGIGGTLMYLTAGFILGFPAGYASHLGLDQLKCTSDIPLLNRRV